jgi:lysophospholipase L1-like esterase
MWASGWRFPPEAVGSWAAKVFDKRVLPRFINTVRLVRRHLARAFVGLAGLSATSTAAPPDAVGSAPAAPSSSVAPAARAVPGRGVAVAPGGDAPDGDVSPVYSASILRLRARAQERILGRDQGIEDEFGRIVPARQVAFEPAEGPPPPNGNALGRFVPIENEGSLAHFNSTLEALSATPERKNKLRIIVYGASHTQADIYASYLRYYLQSRFGNGGAGFIPLAVEHGWSGRIDYKVRARGFKTQYVQQKEPPPHGRFGLAGVAAVGGPHGKLRISPENDSDPSLTASRYDLFYAAEPFTGDISLSVDGEVPVLLPTRAQNIEARYYSFERPLGWHQIEIRTLGMGGARLYGLSVERAQPGIVLDTLGIRGTRAANMLQWDRALWEEHLRRRAPDLVLLAYGTNETTDRGQPITEYAAELKQVLTRLRHALPDASCVLVGPGDFPREEDGTWSTRPRLLEIIREQRRIAPQFGCGFWDAYAFMGGEGSMAEWVLANPRLGAPDHIHLTHRGYVRMGMVLGDALLRAHDARHVQPRARVRPQRGAGEPASAAIGSAGLP